MGRKKRGAAEPAGTAARPHPVSRTARWRAPGWVLIPAAAWALFYAAPLLSPQASIQWDAVDVHYCLQRYLGEEILAWRLPLWTPYVLSGFPFLADPQVGAFYPFNWPFILAGAGPKLIQAEIALHALLALAGALLLFRMHVKSAWSAAAGAMAFALSGFFAGHASHVGMVQAASLLPWLLYCSERALRGPFVRWLGAAGAVAGLMFLAGHLQTALYGCAAMAVSVFTRAALDRKLLAKGLGLLAGTAILAFLISAAMTLPGLELAAESIRAGQAYSRSQEGVLELRALATLVDPDALGARSGEYRGPGDRTQFYFYSGILLLPLAAMGLGAGRAVAIPGTLAVLSLWFMLGPDAGLYRVAAMIQPLGQVRAPVHAWFVSALALAWIAGAGLERLNGRIRGNWLPWAVCLFLAADLCLMNSWTNPLAYARRSFESLYGRGEEILRQRIAPAVPAGMRFAAPDGLYSFGPLNSPLQARVETTYGYNPLQLRRYSEFRQAARDNPRLYDALSAAVRMNPDTGGVLPAESALPKAWFPPEVRRLSEPEQLAELRRLDPARVALVEGEAAAAEGEITGLETGFSEWRIRYRARKGGLLALSLPWFPGWAAVSGGRELPWLRVNHALSGVVAPAGEHEIVARFTSRRLWPGLSLSLAGCLLAAGLWRRGGRKDTEPGFSSHGQELA